MASLPAAAAEHRLVPKLNPKLYSEIIKINNISDGIKETT